MEEGVLIVPVILLRTYAALISIMRIYRMIRELLTEHKGEASE
jgi:hypothetical protein